MRKIKYLPLYYEWIKTGRMPGDAGLCYALELSGVELDERDKYLNGGSDAEWMHWVYQPAGKFDTVRQNMLLLIAAINNEL